MSRYTKEGRLGGKLQATDEESKRWCNIQGNLVGCDFGSEREQEPQGSQIRFPLLTGTLNDL